MGVVPTQSCPFWPVMMSALSFGGPAGGCWPWMRLTAPTAHTAATAIAPLFKPLCTATSTFDVIFQRPQVLASENYDAGGAQVNRRATKPLAGRLTLDRITLAQGRREQLVLVDGNEVHSRLDCGTPPLASVVERPEVIAGRPTASLVSRIVAIQGVEANPQSSLVRRVDEEAQPPLVLVGPLA